MTPEQSLEELKLIIPGNTPLEEAIKRFINFYTKTSIDGCDKNNEGDMLLFQWGGPYSWDNSFSINLTRQFSFYDDHGEYDGMQQLQMNCKYDPALIKVDGGNIWFDGVNANEFCKNTLTLLCVKSATTLPMKTLEFELGDV